MIMLIFTGCLTGFLVFVLYKLIRFTRLPRVPSVAISCGLVWLGLVGASLWSEGKPTGEFLGLETVWIMVWFFFGAFSKRRKPPAKQSPKL